MTGPEIAQGVAALASGTAPVVTLPVVWLLAMRLGRVLASLDTLGARITALEAFLARRGELVPGELVRLPTDRGTDRAA